MLKDISLKYTLYHFYFKDFGIYFIFIEVKIKEFTSMDLTEIKTEVNFIRLRDAKLIYHLIF